MPRARMLTRSEVQHADGTDDKMEPQWEPYAAHGHAFCPVLEMTQNNLPQPTTADHQVGYS
eukprot:17838-Eustigmatos_ZCMA.PRE.1